MKIVEKNIEWFKFLSPDPEIVLDEEKMKNIELKPIHIMMREEIERLKNANNITE